MFKYYNGEQVKLYDVVSYPGFERDGVGHVVGILEPGSEEAKDWDLPEGSVLIAFGPDNVTIHDVGLSLSTTEDEEDLELISRGEPPKC